MRSPISRFSSKTRCKSYVLDRKISLIDNYITIKVSNGNFCRGDQVKVLGCIMVHLSFFVGKLACAISAVFIDQDRGLYLVVPLFESLVKKEVYQTPLQSCTFALVHGKSCSGDLDSQFKINN